MPSSESSELDPHTPAQPAARVSRRKPSRALRIVGLIFPLLLIVAIAAYTGARLFLHHAMVASLPQVDGTVSVHGLAAPVSVLRDAHGVPHLRAAGMDDLIFAQGYVTAQDRLWQMDLLRRHAAGELAELLGPSLVAHDRLQRTLQLGAAAERTVAALPPDQLHWLQVYASGVNASIAEQTPHLPVEFRLIGYRPAPWTPRDSILIGLVMYQDLGSSYIFKLDREAFTSRLPLAGREHFLADLYPVGSWRDHPPTQPAVDLTTPAGEIEQVPLDESQSRLRTPVGSPEELATLKALQPGCEGCIAGSNAWALSGAHTASGKPLLSNDPHLNHTVPGIWYEADLEARQPGEPEPFHVSGVSLPGIPFIVIGHNQHVAWGMTVMGADVQDLYIENTRGDSKAGEFQTRDGVWQPILHHAERIHVRYNPDVVVDVRTTRHGEAETPILTGLFPAEKRTISLRWTIQDPAVPSIPLYDVNKSKDWASFTQAFSRLGGPALNISYADDQGHIGFQAVGRIPMRQGKASQMVCDILSPAPSAGSAGVTPQAPCLGAAPDVYLPIEVNANSTEWAGYIPFDKLPQAFDPPGGLLATANSRITPDGYPYPITINWAAPYRNERIWKTLSESTGITPAAALALQTDVYSELDHTLAQRLAYALDHSAQPILNDKTQAARLHRLQQTADLLRTWDGKVEANSTPAAIVTAFRSQIWRMLLSPHLAAEPEPAKKSKLAARESWRLYSWSESDYALEQIIVHEPARWLPKQYQSWDEFLTAAINEGLAAAAAPPDLNGWSHGATRTLDIEHPIFSLSPVLASVIRTPTGTGPHAQDGNRDTIQQVDHSFGPSERFTADLGDLDRSTLSIVLGQSGDPLSPWFLDQFPAWSTGKTLPMPFSQAAVDAATAHRLILTPR